MSATLADKVSLSGLLICTNELLTEISGHDWAIYDTPDGVPDDLDALEDVGAPDGWRPQVGDPSN